MARNHNRTHTRNERGSIIILVGLSSIVLLAFVGLAIDVGRMYAARAELSRAVDAAALAGVLEFDGTPTGLANAQIRAQAYLDTNEPNTTSTIAPDADQTRLVVDASKPVKMFFISLLGIDTAEVSAHAAAGSDLAPVDAALVIDTTGSMAGTPIAQAKIAAQNFVNTLIPAGTSSTNTKVALAPFRGCYNPPRNHVNCVSVAAMVTNLTNDNATLTTRISGINATGGSGTNVCLGVLKGGQILVPPASGAHTEVNTRRYMVLLSDGDNNFTGTVANADNSIDPLCRPVTNPTQNQSGNANCGDSEGAQEKELDELTYRRAADLKAQGVEIYIVAFGVCSWNTSTYCDASIWGLVSPAASPWTTTPLGASASNDNTRDQNVLKCVASSAAGTNDHAYYADSASDLPEIFTQIAQRISHRLVE